MSILNFIDGSISVIESQDTEKSNVSLTGAFTGNIQLTFSKSGNLATIFIPQGLYPGSGTGDYATGSITFPPGFEPADLPTVGNPIWGVINLMINNDVNNRNGVVQISNGMLSIGNFTAITSSIGVSQAVVLPYIVCDNIIFLANIVLSP